MQNNITINNANKLFVPVKIYNNSDIDKLQILIDNKNKAGIYQWKHIESNKTYIGSAINLSKRLKAYYSKYILNNKKSYIHNALLNYGHSNFSLTIIEYIDISYLDKKKARELILEKEQYYLELIMPEYNILKIAGSSLGYKHTEETIAKISGEKNSMFGKIHSVETKAKISKAFEGKNHPRYGIRGENHPFYGKTHSIEVRARISLTKGSTIYLYNTERLLVNTFNSTRKAAEFLDCSHTTIANYCSNGKLYKNQWFLSIKEIN